MRLSERCTRAAQPAPPYTRLRGFRPPRSRPPIAYNPGQDWQDACATEQNHGQDARATGQDHGQDARATELTPFDPYSVDKREGAYRPHWAQEGATYSVTFRLADSLPQSVLESWLRERDHIVQGAAAASRPLTDQEIQRLCDLHSERVEAYLDAGHGACHMNDPRVARLVREALLHFDGRRYDIIVWCVMPNHVHCDRAST